jgi:hypothetical protein
VSDQNNTASRTIRIAILELERLNIHTQNFRAEWGKTGGNYWQADSESARLVIKGRTPTQYNGSVALHSISISTAAIKLHLRFSAIDRILGVELFGSSPLPR